MKSVSKTNSASLILLFAVVLALAVASVFAQQTSRGTSSPDDPSSEEKAKAQTLSGSVVSVDSTSRMVSIKDTQGQEQKIYVDSSTKIQAAGKQIDLGDIKAGDHVTATVKSDSSGRMVASKIEVSKGG